jgi:integrase
MRGTGLPSPRYVSDELAQARQAIDSMAASDKPASHLTATDLRRVLTVTADRAATARARFGALSRFLDWCQDLGHIQTNPCLLIGRSRRPKAPQARANYLLPADLARLWRAADALVEPVWRDLARFLIAIPCRRNEATQLVWSDVNLASGEWKQPEKMTKNGDPHRLHLHPLAIEVLQSRRQAWAEAEADGDPATAASLIAMNAPASGLVFPAPRSGRKIDTFTDIRADLVHATKAADAPALAGWTWHDFRRSFASALGEAGIPEAVADAVLNHRQAATCGGVLGVYQRSSRWPEQVKAMDLWGRMLAAAIEWKPQDANVVLINRSWQHSSSR